VLTPSQIWLEVTGGFCVVFPLSGVVVSSLEQLENSIVVPAAKTNNSFLVCIEKYKF
jgi:hypothetical protein